MIRPLVFSITLFIVALAGIGPTRRLGYNLVTIVTAVVVRKLRGGNYEVLMMQEAKPSCRGLWYLPAGRLEPNESLEVER